MTFAEEVNYHTWQLARLKVPAAVIEGRPEPEPLQAATNIITELGISLDEAPDRNRTKPTLYALVGCISRGPHDRYRSIRQVVAVRRENSWRDGKRYTVSEFASLGAARGWILVERAEIRADAEPVALARRNGWLQDTDTMNLFEILLFTRDQYH
jgi:hypothetical protein